MKTATMFLMQMFVLVFSTIPGHGPAAKESTQPSVHLRLSVSADKAPLNKPITVRVEMWNRGAEDFYASYALTPILNGPAYLTLEFVDEAGHQYSDEKWFATLSDQAVHEWWIRIAPGHFYGTELVLDPKIYSFLKNLGTFTVRAKYSSKGGLTPPNAEWGVISHSVWRGSLESNPVSITVLPAIPNAKAMN